MKAGPMPALMENKNKRLFSLMTALQMFKLQRGWVGRRFSFATPVKRREISSSYKAKVST